MCEISFRLANLQSRVKKGNMTQEKFEKTISLLKGVLDYESFKDVDMVIEVVWKAFGFQFSFIIVVYSHWGEKVFSVCC